MQFDANCLNCKKASCNGDGMCDCPNCDRKYSSVKGDNCSWFGGDKCWGKTKSRGKSRDFSSDEDDLKVLYEKAQLEDAEWLRRVFDESPFPVPLIDSNMQLTVVRAQVQQFACHASASTDLLLRLASLPSCGQI